ncbi:MAG: NAD(P)H-dependent oxidoreductase [Desulfobacterales bacterium]|nr:NAD(P)H-dependent oxidoreductase [Desulfobacterales bacterium]
MKNVLGIIGSTRKMGNSELVAKMISRHIPEPHHLNLLRVSDLNIKPCLGCYRCLSKGGSCAQKDDMEVFLDAMAKADGVILAVPVYFFGPTGTIKMIIDRVCMMYPRFERFHGKPCLIVILLGIKGKDGYTSAALGSAAMTMGLDIVGETNLLAGGRGEILISDENRSAAKELGQMLFSSGREILSDGRRCNICGSQSFKFIEDGVECLVCQNQGEIISENGRAVMNIKKVATSEVNTLGDRNHHLGFLMGKQKDYPKKREEIKKMSREFSDDGTWIKGRTE